MPLSGLDGLGQGEHRETDQGRHHPDGRIDRLGAEDSCPAGAYTTKATMATSMAMPARTIRLRKKPLLNRLWRVVRQISTLAIWHTTIEPKKAAIACP